MATAFKLTLAHLDPFQLLFVASTCAALCLLGILAVQGRLGPYRQALAAHPWRSLLLGSCNPLLYYAILFAAYDRLPAQVAQPVNYTWAITLSLLAAVFLRQPLRRADLLAALVAYAGVVVIATRGSLDGLDQVDGLGLGLALASTLVWAGYWVLAARDARDPVAALAANFTLAAPGCLLLCLLVSDPFALPWRGVLGGAYVGVFEMGLPFALWVMALRLAPSAAKVATCIFLSPPLSLLLIHLFLGEAIHAATILGLGLILAGLFLQHRGSARTNS